MFYKIIQRERDKWLNSESCVIGNILSYIEHERKMRDAQIDAIKTYLFLKIECENKPLWELFASGRFNSTDVDTLEINIATRNVLRSNPAALALWEYASITDENGNMNSPRVIEAIKQTPEAIDYVQVLRDMFFNVDYTDYLFSIPMGAGKTYLMAAFIYLNLYFAFTEPDNPLFAHNFIILVPSGLKSSIIPSLRDIQNFNPVWILPDPVATQLKNMLRYEWLQEASTSAKSNMVKNPNARKIALYNADPDLMGLVAVTNAEKVILDRVDNQVDSTHTGLLTPEEQAAELANELRQQIGKIPGLCVIIDEVHHASDNQLLRKVVDKWMAQSNFNSVLGFTGTPNMDPPAKIAITPDLTLKCTQYANVVTYYSLLRGLGNFLKVPTVRYGNFDSDEIIEKGLREFFDKYSSTRYCNGTAAKVAIYAPSIATLEEEIFPKACRVCSDLGIDPTEVILKYHKGNSTYKVADDAEFKFATLDSPLSPIRIVLLVGIGREGWNCKSLTGVILSQRNACPQNMVLQISCRCLREVDDARDETALIWLNQFNADKLNKQLQEQQYTTISAFGSQHAQKPELRRRYSRMDRLKLPPIDFYQLTISYETVVTAPETDIRQYLNDYIPPCRDASVIYTQGFDPNRRMSEGDVSYGYVPEVSYRQWLDLIVKESFALVTAEMLQCYDAELQRIFSSIISEGKYSPEIDQEQVRADIRCCFAERRTFKASQQLDFDRALLLNVPEPEWSTPVSHADIFVPDSAKVNAILGADKHPQSTLTDEQRKMILAFGGTIPDAPDGVNNRTWHYLPYRLDSSLEKTYIEQILGHLGSKDMEGVEFYFNGDDTLTDFCIRCYAKASLGQWKYLGNYYPDFLMLTRSAPDNIDKLIIIETKGEGFAGKFAPRKQFMEEVWVKLNNENFGRRRFDFLYIEDTLTPEQRLTKTIEKVKTFLKNGD